MVDRIVGLLGLLLGIEVVEVPVELVEAVHGRQELVSVTHVVLADLSGDVTLLPEQLRQRGVLMLQAHRGTRKADGGQPRPHRQLASDQCGPPCGAARLGIEVGEASTSRRDPVDVRVRPPINPW
jgi:hypothetical protein